MKDQRSLHAQQNTMADSKPIASMEDYAACRQVMRKASRNYSFASLFLPAGVLKHVEALYAVMRVGDDRVDVSSDGFNTPCDAIEDWEKLYWQALEQGTSEQPVLRAYINTCMECHIPADILRPYFRAMKEDINIKRFPTFNDLLHYMEGSALPVGRAMMHILGIQPDAKRELVMQHADSLSIAMQLSNFWRDIGQDWGIGRIYIPLEDLERFGLSEEDIERAEVTPAWVDLLEFEFERTEAYYQHAMAGIPMLASGRVGVMSGLLIYRAIMSSIRRNGYDVFSKRARTTRWEKVRMVSRAVRMV
jgi:phytoene synthase